MFALVISKVSFSKWLWSFAMPLLSLFCNGSTVRWNGHRFMLLGHVQSFATTFCIKLHPARLRVKWFGLRCGQGVGLPWPTEPLPPGLVYRAEIWWDHPREPVPPLMRGGGSFSKATHASLEVLVSSADSVVVLEVIQALPWTEFFQLG